MELSRGNLGFSVAGEKQIECLGHHVVNVPALLAGKRFELTAYLLGKMHGDSLRLPPRRVQGLARLAEGTSMLLVSNGRRWLER